MISPAGIAYEKAGTPGKPLVVFLHGFMGNQGDWRDVTDRLGDQFHCLTVDLPGHGDSAFPGDDDYGVADFCADLVEVIDEQDYGTFSIAGYSMGGRIALYFATVYAMRIDTLVLESASPGIADAGERNSRRQADEAVAARLETGDYDAFLREWYEQPLFASLRRNPAWIGRAIDTKRGNDPAALARALHVFGSGAMPPVWRELDGHHIPTLAIAGALDDKYAALARDMAARTGAIQPVVVDGAGHNVHLEAPELYTSSLLTFLTEHAE